MKRIRLMYATVRGCTVYMEMNIALTWNGMSIKLFGENKNTVRFNLAGQVKQCIRQSHYTNIEYQKSLSITTKYYINSENKKNSS